MAAVSLLVLAVCLARSFEPSATLTRAWRLAFALSGRGIPQRDAAGFWFDPGYADFLAAVRTSTPESATIAILVPPQPDLYVYQAHYQLAPRRIVEARRQDEASFVAAYGSAVARGPGGRPMAGGTLWKR